MGIGSDLKYYQEIGQERNGIISLNYNQEYYQECGPYKVVVTFKQNYSLGDSSSMISCVYPFLNSLHILPPI